MVTKLEQITKLTKEGGYHFIEREPRLGIIMGKGIAEFDKYQITFKSSINTINGISTVRFDTLDDVLKYLKDKKSKRITKRRK